MVYSQAKVIAGGLAHIPIVIGVFYFIMTFFNKRAIDYAEANKPKKSEKKVVETKVQVKELSSVTSNSVRKQFLFSFLHSDSNFAIKLISHSLCEIDTKLAIQVPTSLITGIF